MQTHLNRHALAAFDGSSDSHSAESGFDDFENILRSHTEAGNSIAIHHDVDVRLANDAAGRHTGGSGHLLHEALNINRGLL